MKRNLLILFVLSLFTTSCSTMYKTATQKDINPILASAIIGDLDVSDKKITYTYIPTAQVRRAGVENCVATAINEALAENGNYDVLIETQTAVLYRAFLTRKIKTVTVTGYPAKYKNFQPVDTETIKKGIVNNAFPNSTAQKKTFVNVLNKLF